MLAQRPARVDEEADEEADEATDAEDDDEAISSAHRIMERSIANTVREAFVERKDLTLC